MQKQRLATLQLGDLIGESAFSGDATRKADVIARTDGLAAELTTDAFETLLTRQPPLAWKYQRYLEELRRTHAEFNEQFFHRDTARYVALLAHNVTRRRN